jgi:hypothetical protein
MGEKRAPEPDHFTRDRLNASIRGSLILAIEHVENLGKHADAAAGGERSLGTRVEARVVRQTNASTWR